MRLFKLKKRHNLINNRGTTLVEMIVSFTLLAIFLASAATIIATITTMYYDVKAENYSKQVSDIVLEKIESEIDGAVFYDEAEKNPRIQLVGATVANGSADTGDALNSGDSIVLTDKKQVTIKMYRDPSTKELVVHYFPIENKYEATDWKFDKSVYNHYTIEELSFVRGDQLSSVSGLSSYGLEDAGTYGDDIIVVLLKLRNERYGDYYAYRFVKMYNAK